MTPPRNYISSLLLALTVATSATGYADENSSGEPGFFSRWFGDQGAALYQQHCGDCHLAYQPGLLPPLSWERLVDADDHFGQSLAISAKDKSQIRNHLLNNAAGRGSNPWSYSVIQSLGNNPAPLRISETNFFKQRHDELFRDNLEQVSPSQCEACHGDAQQGGYQKNRLIR